MVCTFGNETLNLGDRLLPEDPCEECMCSTPPEITCTRQTCPPFPGKDEALCTESFIPGQCCPSVVCVSANPPVINVCQVSSILKKKKKLKRSNHDIYCDSLIRMSFAKWASSANRNPEKVLTEVGWLLSVCVCQTLKCNFSKIVFFFFPTASH